MERAPGIHRLPLLERLDAHGHGAPLDAAGLRASIARELGRLLNARSVPAPGRQPSVIDYGLPDPSALYAANAEDRVTLARAIVRAIAAFEPRLLAPQVEVEPDPDARVLRVGLSGSIRIGDRIDEARFGLSIRRGGEVGVSVEAP